ncbi:MAG: NAD(P)H-binding protein, partial [Myxococcales bacterium]|nr:NAD(P)H-binding protein [Myxococcales bacterium]
MTPARPTVVVAGANGFVGRALTPRLAQRFRVIGLSRSERADLGVPSRRCDLLSHDDAARALEGADLAVYLVHAMMPSDRLVQGDFDDIDLVAADNFARAAA